MKPRIRTVIADDSEVIRISLSRYVETHCSVEVVGLANNGREAIQLTRQLKPDLVLMDFMMPEMNGAEATQAIKSDASAPRIVMLSVGEDAMIRPFALAAGADGFCGKENVRALARLIRSLFSKSPAGAKRPSRPRRKRG